MVFYGATYKANLQLVSKKMLYGDEYYFYGSFTVVLMILPKKLTKDLKMSLPQRAMNEVIQLQFLGQQTLSNSLSQKLKPFPRFSKI